MQITEFVCPTIKCEGCAEAVTDALKELDGVEEVTVDVATKAVTVTADDVLVSRDRIASALREAGFAPR